MPRRDTAICSRPVGVELRDVGDLGRLAQQLEELDAAQLRRRRIELRQRGVGQLLRDLAHVLLDARRRTDRLLVLQAGQRGACSPGSEKYRLMPPETSSATLTSDRISSRYLRNSRPRCGLRAGGGAGEWGSPSLIGSIVIGERCTGLASCDDIETV